MLISRTRACTALPAVALAAALALAPVSAHAAEVPSAEAVPAPVEATSAPVDATGAPVDGEVADDLLPTPGEDGAGTGVEAEPTTPPVVGAPAPAVVTPAPAAPTTPAVPAAPGAVTPKAVVVDELPAEEPAVSAGSTVLHPGGLDSVYAGGFTAGDAVTLDVTGEGVDEDLVFTATPWTEGPLVFDEDGWTGFDLAVPVEVPLGTVLTVSVADQSGRQASADFVTAAPLAAPALVVPDGGTEGVVALPGSGAEAGNAVVVTVGAVEDDSIVWSSGSVGAVFAPADARAVEDGADEIPWTTEPQRLDEEFGVAQAIVPVAADGTFETEFDLPAGEYFAVASQIDLETGDASEAVDPQLFALVAAAPAVVPVPEPTQGPAATVVVSLGQAPRAARLAHTGQESTGWAALAAGLVLAGAGLLTAARLRRRS
ncbi:LPXTG cell wall anchor domain-containing protein [Frigoribacterium salinisoli]